MTFLVTGASSGIGRATARALADRGAPVVAVARSESALVELADESGGAIVPVAADVSTSDGVDTIARAIDGQIRGVVHAAGSRIEPGGSGDLDPAALTDHFRVHVGAPIALHRRLAPQLDGARLVYIDSYSATELRQGWDAYSIIKAAAQMAARSAASQANVRVVRVFPGGVRTPLVDAVIASSEPSPARDAFRSLDRDGALAEPGDVGAFIARLLLDVGDAELDATDVWTMPTGTPP